MSSVETHRKLDTLQKIIDALKNDQDGLFVSIIENLIAIPDTVSHEQKKITFGMIKHLVKNIHNEEEILKFQSKLQAVDDIPSVLRLILVEPCDLETPSGSVIIGKGAFSTVCKRILKKEDGSKIPVAIKIPSDVKNNIILREAVALVELKHTHVVAIIGFLKGEKYQIIMEHVTGKNLTELVSDDKISQAEALKIICGIASGMEYVISKKYIHRDLSLHNILVSKNKQAKIADFGLCQYVGDTGGIYKDEAVILASNYTVPPEVFHTRMFSEKSDVWSFAVMCWQMDSLCYINRHPGPIKCVLLSFFPIAFGRDYSRLCLDSTTSVKFDWFQNEEFKSLIRQCLNRNDTRRPPFTHIHKIMKEIKD